LESVPQRISLSANAKAVVKAFGIAGAAIALGLSAITSSSAQQRGPVETFAAIAKASAASYAEYPAFATYQLRQKFHRGKGDDRLSEWSIEERLGDRLEVVVDERAKKESLSTSRVATLIFDALESPVLRGKFVYWLLGVEFYFLGTETRSYRYEPANADAVARSVRGFKVTFANDATPEVGHLAFSPVSDEARNASAHLTDVYYAPSTLLPTRIVFAGPSNTVLDMSYHIVDGKWLLHSSYARHTFENVALFAQVTMENTKTYEDIHLSDVAPDLRLAYPGEVPVAMERLREYAGTYRMATSWISPTNGAKEQGPAADWAIRLAGKQLELTISNPIELANGPKSELLLLNDRVFPLYAKSESRFYLKRASGEIGFFHDSGTNKVTRLIYYQDGFEREGTLVR
jgi:hypothetical protein